MSRRRSASEEAAHRRLDELLFGDDRDSDERREEDEDEEDSEYVGAEDDVDEEDEEDDDGEGEEEEEDNFHDANDGLSGISIEFDLPGIFGAQDDERTENREAADNDGEGGRRLYISREQLMRLLGQVGLRQIWNQRTREAEREQELEDESEPDTGYGTGVGRNRKRGRGRAAFEKVPSEVGRELMESGMFATNERSLETTKRKKRLAYSIMRRELGIGSYGKQKNSSRLMLQGLIPSSRADTIIHYNARCYSGQFSGDGNFFFSCAQDFKVRMYDTSNPYDWKYYKTVDYPYGQWTITDASLSPDNRLLAYSSIRSVVCLAPTDPSDNSEPTMLDFANTRSHPRAWHAFPYFGIWSLRFSGDGREIVAGTGDRSVYVYDIETRQSVLRIAGHENDVNAVCYGDAMSPHILYSGSDDTTLKVWDRRSLGDGREAGVFLGHTEGLTYVDSKGDGRYVLSNAKDQTAKLWDLRKMISKEKADGIDPDRYTTGFEYRSNHFDHDDWRPHPHDCSLVTFRGHQVLKTLIRCHFSPPGSTDSRYIYSGSYDGNVYIWNMDATLAGKINVYSATRNSRPRDPDLMYETYDFIGSGASWQTCVRDASWHPDAPVIAATSWNGWGTTLGTCSVHTWRDGGEEDEADAEDGQSVRVNEWLEKDESLYRNDAGDGRRGAARRRTTRRGGPRTRSAVLNGGDDDDDE